MSMRSTMQPASLIPKGVATLLPEAVRARREIEKKIFSVFFRARYAEVITPMFEYLDTFLPTSGEELLQRAYKFVDRATGRIMVLRPDVTPQIARMAATLLGEREKPLRLCYGAALFRHEEEHAGRERETFQMGGELIGASDAAADVEIITLAIDILKALRLGSFKIVLGQIAFIRGVLKPFVSQPLLFRRILSCVAKKETARLTTLLNEAGVRTPLKKQVLALPGLYGEAAIQKEAASLTKDPLCHAALQRLNEVVTLLMQKGYEQHLFIDLGEVRGFDYYTGITFEIVADGVGVELGGGGRYDHLLEKFGAASPCIGFALHIERIQQAMEARAAIKGRRSRPAPTQTKR